MAESSRYSVGGNWPGMTPGNIDLFNRPSVPNPDGGDSSVYSMSVGFEDGEYLIPRVSDDGRIMDEDEAVQAFKKSGRHLGKFENPEDATAYAEQLHQQQARLANIPGVDGPFPVPEKTTPPMKFADPHDALKLGRDLKALKHEEERRARRPRPPAEKDFFRQEFENALDNPEFQLLPPQEQVAYIHQIFDNHPDDRFRLLPNQERREYVQRQIDQFKDEFDYSQSTLGQIEKYTGFELPDRLEQALKGVDSIPGLRGLLVDAPKRINEAGGRWSEGFEKWAEVFRNKASDGLQADAEALVAAIDSVTGGLIPDAAFDKMMDWAESASKIRSQEIADMFDRQAEEWGQTAAGFRERAEEMPESARSFKGSVMEVGGIADAVDWFTNLAVGTATDIAPALLMRKLTGGVDSLMPFLVPTMTGQAAEVARQQGANLSPEALAGIGLATSYMESLFGAEGVLAKGATRRAYEEFLKNGGRRFLTRAAIGTAGEGLTEVMQDYTTLQSAKWAKGEQELWNNMTDEEKRSLVDSFIGGVALGAPFEMYGNAVKGVVEKEAATRADKIMKGFQAAQEARLSPRERGRATGIIPPHGRVTDTEGQVGETRLRNLPDFVEEDNEEFIQKWVDGTYADPDVFDTLTPEQKQAVAEAEEKIQQEIAPAPKVVDIQTREHNKLLAAIKASMATRAANRSNAQRKEQNLLAAESVRWVEPQEEELQQLQGAIEREFGVRVEFFDYDGNDALNGMVYSQNLMAVRYKGRPEYNAMAGTVLHELVHNTVRRVPGSFRAISTAMKEIAPEEWAEAAQIASENNEGKSQEIIDEETLAYFTNMQAKHIINYLNNSAELSKKENAPRGVKKIWQSFQETMLRMAKASPLVAKITGINPKVDKVGTSELERKVIRMGRLYAEFYQSGVTAKGAATPIVEGKEKAKPRPGRIPSGFEGVKVQDIKVGDVVKVPGQNSPRPYTVTDVSPAADGQIRVDVVNDAGQAGQTIMKESDVMYREQRIAVPDGFSRVPAFNLSVGDTIVDPVDGDQSEIIHVGIQGATVTVELENGNEHSFEGAQAVVTKRAEAAPEPEPAPAPEPEPAPAPEPEAQPEPKRKGKKAKLEDEHGQGTLFEDAAKSVKQLNLLKEQPQTVERDAEIDSIIAKTRRAFKRGSGALQKAIDMRADELAREMATDAGVEDIMRRLTGEKRLSKEELAKVKASDYYQAALKAAEDGNWETPTAGEFHAALQENIAAVTLSPYTEADLAAKDFRLFKLAGTEIYFALKGNDLVGVVNNDMARLPGLAVDAVMTKALEEGAQTLDAFNVIADGKEHGFLPERYARWGWRYAHTDEMPEWAVEIGGRNGFLEFSEEAYLQEHSAEDLARAREYWRSQGSSVDPGVVFMVWDPPAGVTRNNLTRKKKAGEIGTKELAQKQLTDGGPSASQLVDKDTEFEDDDHLARVLWDYDGGDTIYFDGEEIFVLDDEPFEDSNPSTLVGQAPKGGRLSDFDSDDWNNYGNQHGVSNLGGLGKMEKHGPLDLPGGGVEGTWTFEELLWIQSQAYDPNDWTEAEHAQFIRKLHRTLTPSEPDPLQALNHFIFAMISPQLNLTANEIFYSLFRIRDAKGVSEWAARIPWDPTEGEVPGREVYDRLDEADKNDFAQWYAEMVNDKKTPRGEKEYRAFVEKWRGKLEAEREGRFKTLMRDYYSDKIKWEFGAQVKAKGGLGFNSTQPLANVAEMAAFFQKDPNWFVKDPEESWHIFTKRIASQFNGLSNKTAMFGGVWQDPLLASVAAIDRHMAEIFREVIIDAAGRAEFEARVVKAWRDKKGEQYRKKLEKKGITPDGTLFDYEFDAPEESSIDEIMRIKGGTGFVVDMLLAEVSKPILRKYKFNPDRVKQYISDPVNEVNVGKAYMAALAANAKAAKKLGLGFFSYQHMAWDRQRRRVETHAVMYPGLYKLPHMTGSQIATVLEKANKYDRILTQREQAIGEDNEREFRLKRAKPAPLGDLTFADEAPSHTPPGARGRSPLVSLESIDPVETGDTGPHWLIDEESWMGWLRRKIQDKFVQVERLQKKIVEVYGVPIREDLDVYLYEMLYHGRAAAAIEDFEEDYLEPLRAWLRETGVDHEEFEEWLHARHARERNQHYRDMYQERVVERIDAEMQQVADDAEAIEDAGGDSTVLRRKWNRLRRKREKILDADIPTSGMSDEDAVAILDAAGDKFDEGAKIFDRMMNQKLEILLSNGLITQDLYDTLKSAYEFYVPLKGKEHEGDLEDILENHGWSVGAGFDIRGDEVGQSFGRVDGEKHTHPILAQAVLDIEEAIIRSEKNEVGKAFKRLVEEFPNEELYQISKRVRRRVLDRKSGEVKFVADALAKKQANVFAVKEDGETYYIWIKDARLAMAMKNIGNGNHGPFIKVLGAANRLMAKLSTTLNPEFMLGNLARDFQEAMVHLQEDEAQGIAKKVALSIPAAMRGIAGAESSVPGSRTAWSDVYDDFRRNGGKIGFFGYNDVMSLAKGLERSISRQGPGAHKWTFRQLIKFGKLIEGGNSVFENATRLATYKAAVDAGMSKKKAARLARRLTVNFNKKGEWGSTMNAIWLFSNASVQGTARMLTALKSSRRVQAMAAGMYMTSFMLAMMNEGMGGEDEEDGYTYWEKLPDWQKETNLIFMLPDSKGDHLKIPLPYGYSIFNVLGLESYKIASRAWRGQLKPSDIPRSGLQVLDAFLGAFNPLGSTRLDSAWGVARAAVPSIAAPIADTLVNETYYGAPIQPTRSSWDKSPASTRYFEGVTPLTRKLTEWANEMTGGNAYQPGVVDINPEILDYLVGAYAGGGAKTAKRILFDLPVWAFRDRFDMTKIEANDVAFLRRVYGQENDHTVASVFYENVEEIEQAKAAWENLSKLDDFDADGWKDRHGWKMKVFKDLSRIQTAIRKESDPEKKNKLRKEFNKLHLQAWESQF